MCPVRCVTYVSGRSSPLNSATYGRTLLALANSCTTLLRGMFLLSLLHGSGCILCFGKPGDSQEVQDGQAQS